MVYRDGVNSMVILEVRRFYRVADVAELSLTLGTTHYPIMLGDVLKISFFCSA